MQGCSDSSESIQLAVLGEGNVLDSSGPAPRVGSCVPDRTGKSCSFESVPAGRYIVWQGPHVTSVLAGGYGTLAADTPYHIELPCQSDCAGSITVNAVDRCATGGTLKVMTHVPFGLSEPIATLAWVDGVPVSLHNLPCQSLRLCAVGGSCKEDCASPLEMPLFSSWVLDIQKGDHYLIHVLDSLTGAPVVGATVKGATTWSEAVPRTDGEGMVELVVNGTDDIVVSADGYSGFRFSPLDLDLAPSVSEVVLRPSETILVRCQQSGTPCLPETVVFIEGFHTDTRMCSWSASGLWTCAGQPGDEVTARLESARAKVRVPSEGELVVDVQVPGEDGAICLRWEEGGGCSAEIYEAPNDAKGGWRSSVPTLLWVNSGEPTMAPLAAGKRMEAWLSCGELGLFWIGSIEVASPFDSTCNDVTLEPMGQVCQSVPGLSCSIIRVWGQRELHRFTNGCSPLLVAGRYQVECGGEVQEINLQAGQLLEF